MILSFGSLLLRALSISHPATAKALQSQQNSCHSCSCASLVPNGHHHTNQANKLYKKDHQATPCHHLASSLPHSGRLGTTTPVLRLLTPRLPAPYRLRRSSPSPSAIFSPHHDPPPRHCCRTRVLGLGRRMRGRVLACLQGQLLVLQAPAQCPPLPVVCLHCTRSRLQGQLLVVQAPAQCPPLPGCQHGVWLRRRKRGSELGQPLQQQILAHLQG